MTDSVFSGIDVYPADEAFALTAAYKADPNPSKVSLGAGVYRDDSGSPWILPSVEKVRHVKDWHSNDENEYLPIAGNVAFTSAARQVMFGDDSPADQAARTASLQSISGTGACHLGARFLHDFLRPKQVWISDPTWENHHLIWKLAGEDVARKAYPYYDRTTQSLDFSGWTRRLEDEALEGDVIILHACAHNPTGLDPTREQWRAIAELCRRKRIFPFFDSAYQGFASGDLDRDAWAVRHFASLGLELCVAQSFSKNFGLYGQRVGAFHLLVRDAETAAGAFSQLVRLQRGEVSNPPAYGAKIVATVLNEKELRQQWLADLDTMSTRLMEMRQRLHDELVTLGTPGSWKHLIEQIGMFAYTGLDREQINALRETHHIYMMESGRISIAGLNHSNVAYVASCMRDVVKNTTVIA